MSSLSLEDSVGSLCLDNKPKYPLWPPQWQEGHVSTYECGEWWEVPLAGRFQLVILFKKKKKKHRRVSPLNTSVALDHWDWKHIMFSCCPSFHLPLKDFIRSVDLQSSYVDSCPSVFPPKSRLCQMFSSGWTIPSKQSVHDLPPFTGIPWWSPTGLHLCGVSL